MFDRLIVCGDVDCPGHGASAIAPCSRCRIQCSRYDAARSPTDYDDSVLVVLATDDLVAVNDERVDHRSVIAEVRTSTACRQAVLTQRRRCALIRRCRVSTGR